jgi:UDP-N-acetylglucosamine 2-epimerase (non-hydrolysing)
MKVLTVLGTRPEIIRLCRVIELLDTCSEHVVVHTGQNYDVNLDRVFFDQLGVRKPDHHLSARGTLGEQIGTILAGCEKVIAQFKPDRFLLLGDTNSALGAIIAKRMGVPVYHMEAGNRCYDDRVPEEVNRRIIDHSSDILMPYTERSRQNLLNEGIPARRIYVTGNPIREVISHYQPQIDKVDPFAQLGVQPQKYILVTAHRAENVDLPDRLAKLIEGIGRVARAHAVPAVVSVHPRTRDRLAKYGIRHDAAVVRMIEPLPFFEFIKLEQNARLVMTDSGTVQEECAIFGVPNLTMRDNTERPETLEHGTNMLAGIEPEMLLAAADMAIRSAGRGSAPPEYLVENVSSTVAKILLGYR